MATLLELQYDLLATNATFRKRVVMGFFTVARDILDNEPTGTDVLQRSFARSIVMNNDVSQNGYVAAIATDPTIINTAVAAYNAGNTTDTQAAVTDDQIKAAIATAWDTLAGV